MSIESVSVSTNLTGLAGKEQLTAWRTHDGQWQVISEAGVITIKIKESSEICQVPMEFKSSSK